MAIVVTYLCRVWIVLLSQCTVDLRSWADKAGCTCASRRRPVVSVFAPGPWRSRIGDRGRQRELAWMSAEGSSPSAIFWFYRKKLERRAKPVPSESSFLLSEDRCWMDTV